MEQEHDRLTVYTQENEGLSYARFRVKGCSGSPFWHLGRPARPVYRNLILINWAWLVMICSNPSLQLPGPMDGSRGDQYLVKEVPYSAYADRPESSVMDRNHEMSVQILKDTLPDDSHSQALVLFHNPMASSVNLPTESRDNAQTDQFRQRPAADGQNSPTGYWTPSISEKTVGPVSNPPFTPGGDMTSNEHMKRSMDHFVAELLHLVSTSQANIGSLSKGGNKHGRRARRTARLREDGGCAIAKSTAARLYDRARQAGIAFFQRQLQTIQRCLDEEAAMAHGVIDDTTLLRAIAQRHPSYAKPIRVIGLLQRHLPHDFRWSTVLKMARSWLSRDYS
ncbi:hypothetical protein P170DRAFT_497397 [Aspergillus steynii IBT 23096]|uniref:Uncharacterized protein n=1 Tax=Aspergillus steynii IBT 23096 TaxID=1392250 RepID=A0A2I2G5T7_9EURO|nr:uncharacterized protein P170DRAFT_497397 [Aspergillus steynii IBT 23096]PLB48203.1 hypothetical protein P170DRAFT_497397 [Aspergillus steynii IBT 23096]